MKMTYDIPGHGMFHTDCEESGSGIMKDLHKSKPDEDGTILHAYECLHCHKIGYYGIQEKTRVIITKEESEFLTTSVEPKTDKLSKCQVCEQLYMVDINIPDDLWDQIKPAEDKSHHGGGMLCGKCIMERIEGLGNYDVYHLYAETQGLQAYQVIAPAKSETVGSKVYSTVKVEDKQTIKGNRTRSIDEF